MTRLLMAALTLLAACSGTPSPSHVISSTPAMVAICAPAGSVVKAMQLAQNACQVNGRNAELMADPNLVCESAVFQKNEKWVQNYRCVP